MRILQVNKYLHRRAGAETYMLGLAELLVSHGHEVGLWGCRSRHSENPPAGGDEESPTYVGPHSREILHSAQNDIKIFEDLLVDDLNFDRREGLVRDLKKFGHMLWSLEAAKKFDALLRRWRPDIIHIHNIYHQISPSILAVAHCHKIPVVQTVHDYKWICPNYKLFTKGAVCQRCKKYKYWQAIRYQCVQNSLMASGAAAMEMWWHRLLGVYEKNIAKFITPSDFLRQTLIEWGKDKDKIVTIHNFVPFCHSDDPPAGGDEESHTLQHKKSMGSLDFARDDRIGSYILFVGRLAEEKGIWLLLEIAKALPEVKFKIAGTGTEERAFRLKIKDLRLKNVELLGFQQKKALQKLINQARLIIVPSIWHENYGMSILEAMSLAKPVMASNSGGTSEIIRDGETGFLVPVSRPSTSLRSAQAILSEHVEWWVEKIRKVYQDDTLLKKIGQAARESVLEESDPERHYEKMMEIYRNIET